MEIVHRPVMVEEVLQMLKPEGPGALVVDGTLGEGGHSERFLKDWPEAQVVGIDADANIQAKAIERLAAFGGRFQAYNDWYDHFFSSWPLERRADRILLDLGISVYHYQESGRGFSFQRDEPLDMRLREDAGPSVAELVATLSEDELADIIFRFGEERYGRKIARAICRGREMAPITGSKQLAELIRAVVPADYRYGRLHPATRTFQALRIAANGELERIGRALASAFSRLEVGGRFGVITFHSLEDRLVKQYFREKAKECSCPPEQPRCTCDRVPEAEVLTRKAMLPGETEIRENPPSRSAKFRVLRKVKG